MDDNPERRKERERQLAIRLAEKELEGNVEKTKPDPKAEMAKMALTVGLLADPTERVHSDCIRMFAERRRHLHSPSSITCHVR